MKEDTKNDAYTGTKEDNLKAIEEWLGYVTILPELKKPESNTSQLDIHSPEFLRQT